MWLQLLQCQGLRSFHKLELSFTPGINVLFGDNGTGKTSVLEGIDVLSCGKSFRTSKISHIINTESTELILFGQVENQDKQHIQLGVKNINSVSELRVNRERVPKWSQLAKNLPALEIHPESYLLVTGGPIERRKFLNWGMFHVEPSYSQLWAEYSRALKQRNNCLKARNIKEACYWHPWLSENGEKISKFLSEYSDNIQPYVDELITRFGFTEKIDLQYESGWNKEYRLSELLDHELQGTEIPMSTLSGPHRGDLKISWAGKKFSKTSSRGQQKVMAIVLKLAQAKLLKDSSGKSCVYLIDELPAELDQKHRVIALEILDKLNSQVIISAVSKDSIKRINTDAKWFHVKQGAVSAVV